MVALSVGSGWGKPLGDSPAPLAYNFLGLAELQTSKTHPIQHCVDNIVRADFSGLILLKSCHCSRFTGEPVLEL